jgi:Zn-dependent protease with chaperone function
MIWALGFVLECAATALLAGALVGLVSLVCLELLNAPLQRLGPAERADAYLVGALVPGLAALSVLIAAAAPSVGSALGLGADHCPGHGHHFHICFLHSVDIRPALAGLGALAVLGWLYRVSALVMGLLTTRRQTRQLESLGNLRSSEFPVLLVPGTALCHAAGFVRRRIMLSSDIASGLPPAELAAALAHEAAHLNRRDPLASFVLALAGLFVPQAIARRLRRLHRQASEESCDAAAAAAMGTGDIVASALITVATLQRGRREPRAAMTSFGEHALEARVLRLLHTTPPSAPSPSRWVLLAGAAAASFVLLTWSSSDLLHHAAETILGHIF